MAVPGQQYDSKRGLARVLPSAHPMTVEGLMCLARAPGRSLLLGLSNDLPSPVCPPGDGWGPLQMGPICMPSAPTPPPATTSLSEATGIFPPYKRGLGRKVWLDLANSKASLWRLAYKIWLDLPHFETSVCKRGPEVSWINLHIFAVPTLPHATT